MPFRVVRKVFFRGDFQERTTEVPGDLLRIGRGTSNDLQLEDLSVSLNHATITGDDQGRYLIRDVTQTGATYVNRAPIKEHTLRHGDTIRIQHYLLAVSLDESVGSLVLNVQDEPMAKIEPSLALMPKFQLAGGRWTKRSIATVLSLLVLLASVLALAVGQRSIFMPGAVSMKHTKFSNQCEVCHTSVKFVWDLVPNNACQGCHAPKILSPAHFRDNVALTPPPLCASCHLEHKGQRLLADVPDQKCVQCHGDLKAKDQEVPNLAPVHGFMTDHPEFAIIRSMPDRTGPMRIRLDDKTLVKDESTLKLNHQRHLELDADYLATEFGVEKRRMNCADCHRMDNAGQTMLPIRFERDCQRCHSKELEFDSMMPGRRVTHGRQLDIVRQQLEEIFAGSYMQAHPEEAKKPPGTRWIPGRRLPALPQTAQERYMVDRLGEAEKLLLSSKSRRCLKCHETEPVGQASKEDAAVGGVSGTPNTKGIKVDAENGGGVVRANHLLDNTIMVAQTGALSLRIRKVTALYREHAGGWMPYSRFDHQAHASLPELEVKGGRIRNDTTNENRNENKHENWCVACHEQTPRSMKTEDVLLPSIGVCRQCHMEPGGAQANCKSCHDFHVPKSPAVAVGGELESTEVVTP